LLFLAISPDDSLKIRQFLEKRDFDFDLIPNAQAYINFFGNEYPLNVFVDRQGIIRHARGAIPMSFDQRNPQGFMDDREFRRMLGRLAR
jgi:cytochrome c biogenesis protein CcmG, thiol:disulfide interchange protein DsbE